MSSHPNTYTAQDISRSSQMACIGSQARRSVQLYWTRRHYQRLGSPPRQLRVARLGGGGAGRGGRRLVSSWKVRLRAVVWSPARLLASLRDAYVDAMLALVGGVGRPTPALSGMPRGGGGGGAEGLWAKRMPRARQAGARSCHGDFEMRMMAHIYSMLVTPELPGAPKA